LDNRSFNKEPRFPQRRHFFRGSESRKTTPSWLLANGLVETWQESNK
jgi:hypothetical protein